MITLVLSQSAGIDEALASAATGLVFGQPIQLLILAQLPAALTPTSTELLDTLAQIGLPVFVDPDIACPAWLDTLSPRSKAADEQATLLAESRHCLSY